MSKGFRKRWQGVPEISSEEEVPLDFPESGNAEPLDTFEVHAEPTLPDPDVAISGGGAAAAMQAAQPKRPSKAPPLLSARPKIKQARAAAPEPMHATAAAQLQQAILEAPAFAPVKMPWESGPCASLFGSIPNYPQVRFSPLPRVPEPAPPPAPIVPIVPKGPSLQTLHAQFARKDEQDERAKAIRMFHTLVLADPQATSTGKQLIRSAKTLATPGKTLDILADTLATSRTGTLVKHASSLWRFAVFSQPRGLLSPFLADEENLYQYLCHLRKNKAGPTSGQAFLTAFRFSATTFGIVTHLESLDSKRVRGVAHDMYLKKAPRRTAAALTVAAVKHLIFLVLAVGIPKHVRLIAGQLLLCIFGVARWGDLRHMQHFTSDTYQSVVIFEAGSTDHKLASSAEAQVELLPYIGLGVWPNESPWLPVYLDLRQQEGITSGLPAWDWGREVWSSYSMSTAEATSWLRELLAGHMPDHERCRAHSLKTTLLTWAGMSHRFSREEKTLLGHHTEASTKSATTYDRDAMLRLQGKVWNMLEDISQGLQTPDANPAHKLAQYARVEAEVHSENASSASEPEEPCPSLQTRAPLPPDASKYSWKVHTVSGVVHMLGLEQDKLACGRPLSCNYTSVSADDLDRQTTCFCVQCGRSSFMQDTADA